MWAIVLTLIGIGLIILLLEILVIPGAGIAGVIGFGLMVAGVYLAFEKGGNAIGFMVLSGTVLLNILALILALRSKTWDKAMLKKQIDGKVNVVDSRIQPGDQGVTISRCAPTGKALIHNEFYEVFADTDFIDENQTVEVIKVEGGRILVKRKLISHE